MAGLLATAAMARPALRDVPQIDNGLLYIGLADQIRKNCPAISARFFKALMAVRALEAQARDMGYSTEEIRAFMDSDVEKARMRARGEAYLKAHGVTSEDPQSYCALGRAEIEKSSQIGTLLRAK
jgi:hypothetical protein